MTVSAQNYPIKLMTVFVHYTFSKNDVISSARRRYCALGLGNTFSVKRVSSKSM